MRFILKLQPFKTILIIGLFLLNTSMAYAGVYPFSQRISTTPGFTITTTASTTVTVSSLIPSGTDVSVLDKITLGVDHTYMSYLSTPHEIRVKLKLEQWDKNNNALTTLHPSLTINYQPFSVTSPYIDKSVYNFTGAYKYIITIDSILEDGFPAPALQTNLFIDADIQLERYLDFSTDAISPIAINAIQTADQIDLDCDNITDELQITWPPFVGAEEYQLEWTFVNDYDTTLGSFITPSATNLPYDFKNNSTRITTTNSSYNITTAFEHGYLLYRVRGIGRDMLNPSQDIVGVWSMADKGNVSSVSNKYHNVQEHEANKNWQFSATYAEEGKKKEVVSYFDGSLRNRQSVTKVNSDKNAIVGETIYDHQGRPAVNVLPVPVEKPVCTPNAESVIRYYPNFNKADANTTEYSRVDFDLDTSPNDSCSAHTKGMDTTSGASNYYSPANPNKTGAQAFVPDGEKFPFTQIEYTPDNTGRIRRQGGVGPDYQLGTQHETKYFYAQPNQIQLDRMFGSEAGDAAHYKKNMVVDANGQVSVSYLDQEGRTIATSLAGDAPTDAATHSTQLLESLSSEGGAVKNLTIDLFAKNANGLSNENTRSVQGDVIEFNSQLSVAFQSNYAFQYDLHIDTVYDACLKSNICFNCIYDLQIKVTDDCGRVVTPVTGTNPVKKTVGHFTTSGDTILFTTNCSNPSTALNEIDTFKLNLPIGNYTVSKTLTINSDARNFYVKSYLDTINTPTQQGVYKNINSGCIRTFQSFIDSALAKIDTADCNITCATCTQSLQTINGTYYADVNDARDAFVAAGNGTELDFDYLSEECGKPCKEISVCETTYEILLMDVSPDGQYALFQNDANGNPPDLSLSVLNTSNVLPKSVLGLNANWKNPIILVNGNTYHYYLNDNGIRSTITLIKDTASKNYLPKVSDTSLVYMQTDSSGNAYRYTYPENLANVTDFVTNWTDNWAQSLVQYHPEYCYYQSCLSYSQKPTGFILSSDDFDVLLEKTDTYAEAVTNGLITGGAMNFSADPFETNLTTIISNYQYYSGNSTYYTMVEMAAIAARCATQYGSVPAHGSACTQFGTGSDNVIKDQEWNLLKNFYLSEKQKLQTQRDDDYARGSCNGYNGCIGNSGYNPFTSGMVDIREGIITFYNSTQPQPCDLFYYHYYLKKIKRFNPQSNDATLSEPSSNNADYQVYQQTGQCPLAYDLQGLLTALGYQKKLTNTSGEPLKNHPEFTQDMYKALSGDTLPATFIPYTWTAVTSGDVLNVNIANTTSTVCTLQLNKTGTGIVSWDSVASISQLKYTITNAGNYEFTATATIANSPDSLKPFSYKKITGSTCIQIANCSFEQECTGNDLANELRNLWSLLASAQAISQRVPLASNLFVTTNIQRVLSTTSDTLVWKYNSIGDFFELFTLADSAKQLVIKFTDFGSSTYTSTNLTPTVAAFADITGSGSNLFTVKGVDTSNTVLVSIKGFINLVDGTDTTAVSMGTCALPTPILCSGDPYQLRTDLQGLLADALLTKPFDTTNVDLTKSLKYTNLISFYAEPSTQIFAVIPEQTSKYDYFPVNSNGDSEEQLYFNLKCECTIVINHTVKANTASYGKFANLSGFSQLTAYGTPALDNNYYKFYALASYAGGEYRDTIFGESCLPLQNCTPVISSDTIVSPTTTYVNPCILYQFSLAHVNAQNAFNQYFDSLTTGIADKYNSHCMSALEDFSTKYNDKEYHFTLYYYDQAGNLIRTIPPEGVQLVTMNTANTVQINQDRTYNQHTFFTEHTMPTTYLYNSLNQLVRQNMPDHDLMDIWDYKLPNGLDSRLKITATRFVTSTKGYLSGYVGADITTARGSLYTSDDGGATWTKVNNLVASDLKKIQMVDATTGYAVGTHGIILKTIDAGNSWDMISLSGMNITSQLNDLYFTTALNGAVIGNNGIVVTTVDGGTTFVSTAPTALAGIQLNSVTYDGTNFYIAGTDTQQKGKLFKGAVTDPTGTGFSITWTAANSIRSTDLVKIQMIDPSNGVAVGVDGTLLSTADGGTNWTTIATGISADFKDIHFKNTSEGIAIINTGQIYKTSNGGISWTPISATGEFYNSFYFYQMGTVDKGYAIGNSGKIKRVIMTSATAVGLVNIPSPSATANFAAAYFTDANNGWIVGNATGTAYYTHNANSTAVTWTSVTTSVSTGFKDIYFNTTSNNGIALATDGKLYKIVSNTFTQISTGNLYSDIDDNTATVYGFNITTGTMDYISKSSISSSTTAFTSLSGAITPSNATATASLNAQINGTVYVAGANGNLFKGAVNLSSVTWTDNSTNIKPLALNDIQAAGTNAIYAVGSQGTLLQTTNGIDWNTQPTGTATNFNAIQLNTTKGLIAGDKGYLSIITIPTVALTNIPLTTSNNLYDIALNTSNKAYIAGASGTIVSIPDITSPVPALASPQPAEGFRGIDFKFGSNQIYAVGDNTAVYSYNSTSGAQIKTIYTPTLTDVNFTDAQNGYAVGYKGTIRTTTDGGNTWQYINPVNSTGGSAIPTLNGVWTTQTGKAVIIGNAGYAASTDGTTTNVFANTGTANLYDIAIQNGKGYIVGNAGATFKTTNNGTTWSTLGGTSQPTSALRAIHIFTDNSFMAVGDNKTIAYYNGSSAWISHAAPSAVSSTETFNDVFFHDDRNGYVAGNGGVILRCSLPVNISTITVTATNDWTLQPVTGNNGIASSDSLNLNISTIDFASRYNGFIGVGSPLGAGGARLINDESQIFSTRFWYDRLGRMVVSQNTKQYNKLPRAYSYTKYDVLGRIAEVGEKPENTSPVMTSIFGDYVNGQFNPNIINDANLFTWINAGARKEVTHTYYDNIAITGLPVIQNNLRKRVSSVTFEDVDDNNIQTYNHATHYSYDIHGNVDTLLQDNQQLSTVSGALSAQRFKKIAYDFDLISGKVNLVRYQDGQPDAFYHFYEYDADNRITAVYTSNYPQANALININTIINNPLWDNDAKYFYYATGALSRVEYGDNKVQGMDYVYTLQGWIKGVNSNTLDTLRDIGKDGAMGSVNSIFAKDGFGYTLNYHANDYKAIDGLKWNTATNRFESIIAGSDLNNSRNDLFNGNITSMVTTIVPPTLPKTDSVVFSPLPEGTAYRYDQLNRLVEMKAWQNLNTVTNAWGSGLTYNGMYHNKFTYDANGSMLTAMANNQAGQTIDKQIYHHQMINGRKFSNRTYAITDSATITSGNDLLNQIAFTDNADSINSFNNYSYTEIGERKSDKQDSIALITWTVYGNIDSVARVSGSSKNNLKFDYDGSSNKRIAKHVYTSNNTWLYSEYYIRDAKGELLSTYIHQVIDSTSTVSFAQTEKEIYGSSELGIEITKTEMISTLPISNIFTRTLDNKHYTGSNHLGNVLVTFTDRKLPLDLNNDGIIDEFYPDVIASNDYMPFGALLTERTFNKGTFPNSFNGKRNDKEFNDIQNYGAREYTPKGREFLSIDPMTKQYPWYTPYQFAGNKPIWAIDIDGLEEFIAHYLVQDGKVTLLKIEHNKEFSNAHTVSTPHGTQQIAMNKATGKPFSDPPGSIQYKYYALSENHTDIGGTYEELNITRNLEGNFVEGKSPVLTAGKNNSWLPSGLLKNGAIYIGANNPSVVINGKKRDDYRREPTDIIDAFALQHDKDYDKLNAKGEEGTKALRTTSADERLLNAAKQIIEKNYKGEKQIDPYTNKPVSQETVERAKMVVSYFSGLVESKKARIAKGAKIEATPSPSK